jgi:hypothetical protein
VTEKLIVLRNGISPMKRPVVFRNNRNEGGFQVSEVIYLPQLNIFNTNGI